MKALLVLEDGKSFSGDALSAGESVGEIAVQTPVVGYQEMLTDPANAGKMLVLTYPLIGNYGVAAKFNESTTVWPSGLVIKEKSRMYSNWQAKESLDDFLQRGRIVTIAGVDTRTLAVHVRQKGEMGAIVSTRCADTSELLNKIKAHRNLKRESLLPKISVQRIERLSKRKARHHIAILDIGITRSIIAQLERLGCAITLLPHTTSPRDIIKLKPEGLVVSNGPEEDVGLGEVEKTVSALIQKFPILGISTGHQVLARALGAKVVRMKVGHHGVNHPVLNPASFKGEITAQNHSYVVEIDSINKIKSIKVTGFHLNDRSIEEFESKKLKVLGIQYYPACPGFEEVSPALRRFTQMVAA
jgi:carbamoyl-phosphate synthase small subunit